MRPTARRRHLARLQTADQNATVRPALNAMLPVLGNLQRVPLKAWLERQGSVRDLKAVLWHNLSAFAPVLADAALAGHLRGRYRAALDVAHHKPSRKKSLGRYDDAIEYYLDKLSLEPREVAALEQRYSEDAVKVLRGASDALEEKLERAVGEIVAEGMHVKGGIARMREAFEAAGATPAKPQLLETLVRKEVSQCYARGQWQADRTPELEEYLAAYQYVTVGDMPVREDHAALDGMTAAKNNVVWETHWPPIDWNCRCTVIKLFDDEQWDEWIPSPLPPANNEEGFGYPSIGAM